MKVLSMVTLKGSPHLRSFSFPVLVPLDSLVLRASGTGACPALVMGDRFIQLGNTWRLCDIDGVHFVLQHNNPRTLDEILASIFRPTVSGSFLDQTLNAG